MRLLLIEKIKRKTLVITATEQTALKYQNDLQKAFGLDSEIFPYQNVSMYEAVSPNRYDYAEQIRILREKPGLVIVPVKALLEKFPREEFFEKNCLQVRVGDEIDIRGFSQKLLDLGYKRSTMVSDIAEFSVRGDIIDVFAPGRNPVRIERWGDEIVDLRYFDNETQKSVGKTQEAQILPVYKFVLPPHPDPLPEGEGEMPDGYEEGIDARLTELNPDLVIILDWLDGYTLVFDETSEIYSKYQFLEAELEGRGSHVAFEDFVNKAAGFVKIGLNNFIDAEMDDIVEFDSQPVPNFDAKIENIEKFIKSKLGYQFIVATDYPERVKELLPFEIEYTESISAPGSILEDCKTVILTDRELFNKRSKEITASKRSYFKEKPEFIESINDIKEGEYVVHSIHGVGIYLGLTQQEIDKQLKDYLTIEYASGDKLHIPAEQINLLARYRGGGQSAAGTVKPKLSRMGGKDWENTKGRVKKEVEEIALDLLRLYAKRKMQTGIAFPQDTTWQVEMEDAFEFTETPDQMRSIMDVKADMESETPMDRLICGDVGFGKTEVAMRAIFKAVTAGKQAAVIVPTTILALQHFQTVSERFKPFGVDVELLSRFRSTKEQKETIKNMAAGKCDVVIGTHRLLQEGIVFKDLGLLVIDEEHRFGVRHKEKLKHLRENIDIITMSATPIPRTLYMSLSGIKDISIINTPPKNRLPIKTYVGEWNENTVKNAIIHELDREGQVFYLYNRVETIEEFRLRLQALVPHARIAVGHGQMPESMLEKVIVDFAGHEYDILLASTIIENGIDIPNANTMIIHGADKFGLAQLYQLRGRVGRSQRQAYCYCLYSTPHPVPLPQGERGKLLSKEAWQRLKAIKEFTTLGSGYQIAMRDVEIRGVGNILGTKQHGHMINVGFDTYCQLLEETVQELQGNYVPKTQPAIVDINVTAFIPDDWVGSGEQKMIEYKRLADVKSDLELDYIIDEWKDRFSKPPVSVENLIKLIKIRLAATGANICAVRETSENIRIYTPFAEAEWKIIRNQLPDEILKKLKFTLAPKSCQEGVSVLLLNNMYMNFDEVHDIIINLMYHINKISHDYTNKKEIL
jgi:transcription-repair coupling factor (superfamily II helicase)